LWRVNGMKEQAGAGRWTAWLLALTFVPTGFVLILGQITPIILLGLTALLYFERKENWFAFGAALAILSIKPHLIYLFWIVLVLWIWQRKKWRVALGAAVAGICAAAMPLLFDSQVYAEYFALHRLEGITQPFDWPAPTLGNVVKFFFHFDSVGLQLLPSLIAVVWVIYYWRRHQQAWRWSEQLPLIILVSVASNFFVWTYDQVILLPVLIQATSWLVRQRLPWYRSIAALLYIAINLAHAMLRCFVAEELWYFWLAPALLIAYLVYRWEAAGHRLTAG
jgi:Glycosyltransferase family 87